MIFNVLADTTTVHTREEPDFLLSEYLSDTTRIHHETAWVDAALYQAAVAEVQRLQIASPQFLRRQLQIDYTQASALIRRMETGGIIQRTTHGSRDSRRGWRYEVV